MLYLTILFFITIILIVNYTLRLRKRRHASTPSTPILEKGPSSPVKAPARKPGTWSPSSFTTPTPPPLADGPVLRQERVTMRVPRGWQVRSNGGFSAVAFDAGVGFVNFSTRDLVVPQTLDERVASYQAGDSLYDDFHRLADREVNGHTGYVLFVNRGNVLDYQWGTVYDAYDVAVTFRAPDRATLQRYLTTVLPTLTFQP